MKKLLALIMICGALLSATAAFAHSGGTNAAGCHNDNIHGGYHCH